MAWKLEYKKSWKQWLFAINYSAGNVAAGEIAIVSIFHFLFKATTFLILVNKSLVCSKLQL